MREFRPVFVRRPVPRCGGGEHLIRASYSIQTIVCSRPARLVYASAVRHDALLRTCSGCPYNEISLFPYDVIAVRTTWSVSCRPLLLLSIASIVLCCRVLWFSFRTSRRPPIVARRAGPPLVNIVRFCCCYSTSSGRSDPSLPGLLIPRHRIAVRWYHESRHHCNLPQGRINL